MRVVHYLNQFFGGLGAEAAADAPLSVREGAVGPGRALQGLLGQQATIVATLICGDNTAQRSGDEITAEAVRLAREHGADVLAAGPAFQSGRYGLACAALAARAQREGLRAVVAMHPENPGVSFCPTAVPVVVAGENAADMLETLQRLAPLLLKVGRGEPLGPPAQDGYVERELRRNAFATRTAAERAVDMLLAKMAGRPFATELPRPRYGSVVPAPPVAPSAARIALISSGGVVPRGNPDRLEASTATKWLAYSIAGRDALPPDEYECIHAGFDTFSANRDPHRVVPLDVCRALEAEGAIGALDDTYYVTVGNLTPVASAERFAREIAGRLRADGVQGVILTAT